MQMDTFNAIILGLAPSIGIGFLFYKVMRAILEGDRNERVAHSQWEAAHEADERGPVGSVESRSSTT